MIRSAVLVALLLGAVPATAQTQPPAAAPAEVAADARAVYDALLLPRVVEITAQEGRDYGEELALGIFGPTPVPAEWGEIVSAIYDPAHMEAELLAALARSLEGEDLSAILAFLQGEPGARLMALEAEARAAMSDEEREQEAREAAAVAIATQSPRLDLLRRLAEANEMIETNVAGALNGSYAYMMGLMDGAALPAQMTEADILSDLWSQEGAFRANASEWIYAYLLLAYEEASDDDLEALIAFSETGPGQALNRAIYDAFDERQAEIQRALGLAAARFLTTEAL